jgi:hypothetical protein
MKRLALLVLLAVGLGTRAEAAPIVIGATNGNLAATVSFEVVGSNLRIILSNTSGISALVPQDILTAVFFDLVGYTGALAPVSAVLNAGSAVLGGGTDAGGGVGGEWAYAQKIGGLSPEGQQYGISSSGLGIFGSGNFGGTNLEGPPNGAVNGVGYGITTAGSTSAAANPKVTGTPLISHSVIFLLSGLPSGFALSYAAIQNVSFQYGTSPTEPRVRVTEPATLLLVVTGIAAVLVDGVRSRRKRRTPVR